jgi:peptidoglycan hydrolase CwlO-like protein
METKKIQQLKEKVAKKQAEIKMLEEEIARLSMTDEEKSLEHGRMVLKQIREGTHNWDD